MSETTRIGYVNRNDQEVIESTNRQGNDHNQKVYILKCKDCKHEYGANGSDIFQRKCPSCQTGRPGI